MRYMYIIYVYIYTCISRDWFIYLEKMIYFDVLEERGWRKNVVGVVKTTLENRYNYTRNYNKVYNIFHI